jgi:2-desacetyl-2-hydroxyethyl bacteriochlorophyllide A dehydrogenase
MRAVVFPQAETISVETVPEPQCAPDEVIVRVASCGICGTDVHIYRDEYMSEFPLIPGHEFSGEVVEVGGEVADLMVGDRVAVDPNLDCGHCDYCRRDEGNHCRNWQGVGITRPGGFVEYTAVPGRACYRLPEGMTSEQAAFVEPLACVVFALRRMRPGPGDSALVFGAGPMGLLLLQALRHSGTSRVVMVDKRADRLALAGELGASEIVMAGTEADAALKELAADGFPVVVDATGVPAVIEQALGHLRPRGQYLQFGVAPRDATIQLNPYDVFQNDWHIIGSFAAYHTFLPAIAWLANGVIDVNKLVSHRVGFDGFEYAFHAFAAGETLKVHVQANGDD